MSAHNPGESYWGTLINPDKSPAPLLEQLCLGIAQLISTFDDNCGTTDLTPNRLATFYRKVGGNYDTLFLKTKAPSLSFIYQSLGCFHSLQPSSNAFEPPSTPALLPHGFVRWQTIQILLDPDEHSQYLQNAVDVWDVVSPDGSNFPKSIPRDAFPSEPDAEMVQWHEEVSRRLEYDYWKRNTPRPSPSFGAHYNYVNPNSPIHNDGYFPRAQYRPPPHVDQDPPYRRHRRRSSAEHPSISRKVQSAFSPRSEARRPGFASPRAPSPPASPERRKSKTGKRFPFRSPFNFGTDSDASSEDSRSSPQDRSKKRSGRHRKLGVEESHARRHSHEAYSRKPRRDLSPDYRRSYRDAPGHTRRHGSDARVYANAHGDDSRSANVRIHPIPVVDPVGPEIPIHLHPRYVRGTGNYLPRRGPDDRRRSSYSGSSGRSSGSGSERTRSYNPGVGHRTAKWANPMQNPARCIPVCVAEDVAYGPGPAMYDR